MIGFTGWEEFDDRQTGRQTDDRRQTNDRRQADNRQTADTQTNRIPVCPMIPFQVDTYKTKRDRSAHVQFFTL